MGTVLVGRECEKQRIIELLDDSTSAPGSLRLVQLDGAIGTGKSSLLAYAIAHQSRPVFLSHGDRLNAEGPLVAHRAMLEQLLGQELEDLMDANTPQLLALRCAKALGSEPTLIAVDDAQWLDPASEGFLAQLIQAPITAPLTVLVVHRSSYEPAQLISAARRRGAVHEQMTLAEISDEAIAGLIAGLTPEQVSAVVEAAQGNPLFARTAAAGFRRHPGARRIEDVLRLEEGSQSAVLAAAIDDEVETLSESARRLIQALAVLGGPSDEMTVQAVTDLNSEDRIEAVSELSEAGLLAGSPHENLHPVVRFSVYQQIQPQQRIQAHRRAAYLASSETLSRAEHLARIAAYLDADETATLVEAGALAIGSEPATVLRWLSSIPTEHRSERSDLLLARAELLSGDLDRASDRLRALLNSSDSTAVKIQLANVLRTTGDLHEARAVLSGPSDTLEAGLLRELIDLHGLLDGRAPEHLVDQLAALDGEENRVAAATYRTMDLLAVGSVREARRMFAGTPGWMLATDSRTLRNMLHTGACAVWCAYMLEAYAEGADIAARALTVAQRFGQADVLANLGAGLAFNRVQLAQIPEVEAAAQQAVLDARAYGPAGVEAMARTALLIAAQAHADTSMLRQRYHQLKEAELPGLGWWRRAVLTTLTRVSALLGEPEPCPELLGEPQDVMAPLRCADAALVAAAGGQAEVAHGLLQQGLEIAEDHGTGGQRAMLQVTRAEIRLRGGAHSRSRELFTESSRVFEQLGMALQLGRVRAGLARLEAARQQQNDPLNVLTPREREIAQQIAQGLTSREIAEHLTISRRTVENHTANIIRKLKASSRLGVVALIQRHASR